MVEWKKLGDICDIKNGYTPSTKNPEFWDNGEIPWFTLEDIRKNGRILNDAIKHITPKGIKKSGLFPENSIIISTTATIGEYALITTKFICNQQITSISLKNDFKNAILIKYLFYLSEELGQWCKKNVNGGGSLLIISTSKLQNYPIPIPSKSEQERIVSILDTFTSSIANLKEQIKERRKQYEHYRDQLLDLEGKERVEMKTLGEVCEITDYVANGSFASLRENVEYKQEPDYALLVRTVDLSQNFEGDKIYINEHAYNFLAKSVLHGGEIIINNIGAGVGKTFRCPYLNVKMSLAPNSIMVRTTNNDFYYYWFSSLYGQTAMSKIITPGAMPKFNKTGFKTIVIPIPPKQTQSRIVTILDQFEASIANLEAQLKEREKQYEYYRNQLLTFE